MEIVGGGRLHVFSSDDEAPHTPGPQDNWQESFVLFWYDAKQSIGGFHRIGHEPNHQGGRSQILTNIFSPEGVFHRTAHLPLEPRHRTKTSIASGDDTVRYEYDGKMRWSVRDSGIEMDLEVEEYVPPVDGHRREGVASAEGFLGAHIDASCDVSGTLKVKGKTYQIRNAYAVRDHAWGPRAWKALLSHRWTIATLDRHNSFVAMNLLSEGSPHASFGWVFRDDKVIFAKKVDIKAIIGMDGGTNYGGTTRLTLTTGEIFEVKFEPYYPCVASRVYNVLAYDALCRASWGDKVGFGVFETSNNLQGGTLQPEVFEDAYGPDGWHEAKLLMAGC